MAALTWVWPRQAERWRKPALVAGSVAFHTLLLGYIALRAFDAPEWALSPPGDHIPVIIPIEMLPRPLLPGEQARVRPPTRPRVDAQPLPGSTTAPPDLPFRKLDDEDDRPTAPVPHLVAPGAPGAPAPPAGVAGAWTVRPEAMGDRVARSLRGSPIGCATPGLLTERDRVECDQSFGEAAARAAPIEGTGHPERDARFAREGARALARYEERRRPLAGGTGVVGPQDGPGSNFGMGVAGAHLDPSLRPDSTRNVHTRRDTEQARDRGD